MREATDTDCFLCTPDERLVVAQDKRLSLIAGLGPITSRYLMIAAPSHVRSFADFYLADQSIALAVEALREKLEYDGLSLQMTEHGRVPMCKEDGDTHETHCFHAHFLLFNTDRDIETIASSYFMGSHTFDTLSSALQHASTQANYYLLSSNRRRYVVYHGPLNVPRQFFRFIVALSEDKGEMPDWRQNPNWDIALKMAESERNVLRNHHDTN